MRRVRIPRPRSVIRSALLAVGATAALGVPAPAARQVKRYALEPTDQRPETNARREVHDVAMTRVLTTLVIVVAIAAGNGW